MTTARLFATDLTTLTPAEVDTLLFPLWADRWQTASYAHTLRLDVACAVFPAAAPIERGRRRRGIGQSQINSWHRMVVEADAKIAELNAKIAPLEAEYARRPWTRFDLVRGGHLHKRGCHTLRPLTARLLLAESSGLTDAEVVDRYSYTACTHCFPDAPVYVDAPDPAVCAADPYDVSGRRAGRWATCNGCGQGVSLTSTGKARKHRKEPAKA